MKEVNFDKLNREIKDSTIKNISITKALGYLTKPFDKQGVAQKCYERGYDNPNNKYYRMTVDEIIESWNSKAKTSMEYGKKLDSYIGAVLSSSDEELELYKLYNNVDTDERLKAHCHAFDEFYKRMTKSGDTYIVCREQPLFYKLDDNYSLQGRFDALAYNKRTKKLIVIDWKSNAEVETNIDRFTENLLGPANDLPAKSWWTYTMQTFFYRMCLEQPQYLEYMKSVVGDDITGISTLVVNLPEHSYDNPKACMGNGDVYSCFGPAFDYNIDKMNSIFDFCIKVDNITSKKKETPINETKKVEMGIEEDLF
jgi:hypothetical protein